MATKLYVIIILVIALILIVKSLLALHYHIKFINAIGNYNIDRINRGLGIDWDLYFNDLEPFERTVCRLWDWGYKRILPPDKFEIIKPYLKKGK